MHKQLCYNATSPTPFDVNNYKYDEAAESCWCPEGKKPVKVETVTAEDKRGMRKEHLASSLP